MRTVRFGPADWVTATRAVLVVAVAALVAASFAGPGLTVAITAVSSVALALDFVDGQVARRTGTASAFGAGFDMEVDAFLILVLSVAVSRQFGWWVLAIGLARYALLVAGRAAPWLAAPVPARYWRKVVAAVQGVVLTTAVAGVLPHGAGVVAVVVALLLLLESFGRDVVWLYRNGAGARTRRRLGRAVTAAAFAIVWLALVVPDRLALLTPAEFVRIPLEGVVAVAVLVVLPARPARALAALGGVLLGLLVVLKALDMGFYEELDRPFNPVIDLSSLGPAVGVLRDSVGRVWADVAVGAAVLGLLVVVALVTAAMWRISGVTVRHRRGAVRGVAAFTALTTACVLLPGSSLVSTTTAALAAEQVRDAQAAVLDQQRFDSAIHGSDTFAGAPASALLTGLRGKDVIVAFVESYGQVAVQGTPFSPGVDAVLRAGTRTLQAAGYGTRSAFLESPTFGGISWLAHSTLQSGLWVDNQRKYDALVASRRFTLSDAFGRAGWRTVADVPSDTGVWPQGTSFYHYDQLYNGHDVGYRGPKFSYAAVPDQYTLAAFQRAELAPGHAPVMAEIDLVSSHTPWTPLPRLVPWDELGDGSIYAPMPAQGLSPAVAWRDTGTVRRLYGQSIQYSLQSLVQWVTRLHDDNLVLVLLGDHQPNVTVSGTSANHLVPITVVAHDPAVLGRIAPWGWQDGMLPGPAAPVWPMDAFRDRFLTAFGPQPPASRR